MGLDNLSYVLDGKMNCPKNESPVKLENERHVKLVIMWIVTMKNLT